MNITRMHILGQSTRVYSKGKMVPNVHEVSVPHSRDGRGLADIWFVVAVGMGVLGTRNMDKVEDVPFTLIFTDLYGNAAILWSNETQEQQAWAWESLGEGPLAMG